ncbi:MAG: hypothetical protein QW794_08545 [Thermosphaera sp.]
MLRYICGNCGFVLYEYRVSTIGVPSPVDVLAVYKGRCPRCGKLLEPASFDNWRERVRVSPRVWIPEGKSSFSVAPPRCASSSADRSSEADRDHRGRVIVLELSELLDESSEPLQQSGNSGSTHNPSTHPRATAGAHPRRKRESTG